MSTTAQGSSTQRWLINAGILAGSGALLTYLALWLSGLIVGGDARLLTGGPPLGVMLIVCLVLGTLAYWPFTWLWPKPVSCAVVLGWWALYFIVMFVAQALPMSPIIYLLVWLALGGLGAWLINASPQARMTAAAGIGAAAAATTYAKTRPGQDVIRRSDYGRVPPATIVLLTQHVRTANGAAQMLPGNAPKVIRNTAVQVVLDHILRDWWENGNREGLTPTDSADMGAFVQLAWKQAANAGHIAEASAIFKAVLTALLDDWFASWNANGVDGAPRWQWEARP